jgi:hypothetical protein
MGDFQLTGSSHLREEHRDAELFIGDNQVMHEAIALSEANPIALISSVDGPAPALLLAKDYKPYSPAIYG